MDGEQAAKLIDEVGIHRLCHFDGCLCGSCQIQGVEIDILCRKSTASLGFNGLTVRVHSRSASADPESLKPVAISATREMRRLDGWSPIRLRYCSYEQDKKNLCVYCGRQREESSGYLCPQCLVEKDPFGRNITQSHDFRRAEFSTPVQNNED